MIYFSFDSLFVVCRTVTNTTPLALAMPCQTYQKQDTFSIRETRHKTQNPQWTQSNYIKLSSKAYTAPQSVFMDTLQDTIATYWKHHTCTVSNSQDTFHKLDTCNLTRLQRYSRQWMQ
jgi:hypothetical protein